MHFSITVDLYESIECKLIISQYQNSQEIWGFCKGIRWSLLFITLLKSKDPDQNNIPVSSYENECIHSRTTESPCLEGEILTREPAQLLEYRSLRAMGVGGTDDIRGGKPKRPCSTMNAMAWEHGVDSTAKERRFK